ncbi:MAG: SDR family oxidoreductase [Polyangiaceae bacterium]|nr:SDR family oxidoreductase [Polyangiaceae bacterium]
MAPIIWKDRWAFITGPTSGIGKEFARQLAARGSHLILVARREDRLRELAADLEQRYQIRTEVLVADLADRQSIDRIVRDLRQREIRVEHLINNAGFGYLSTIAQSDSNQVSDMIEVNCSAVTALVHAFLPAMLERRSGGILTVASTVGFFPMPYMAAYAASKAYAKSFMVALGEELRGSGVRSLALCPGRVPTEFEVAAGFEESRPWLPGQLTAEETARLGIVQYERGRSLYISGFANLALTFLARLLPAVWMAKIVGNGVKSSLGSSAADGKMS